MSRTEENFYWSMNWLPELLQKGHRQVGFFLSSSLNCVEKCDRIRNTYVLLPEQVSVPFPEYKDRVCWETLLVSEKE